MADIPDVRPNLPRARRPLPDGWIHFTPKKSYTVGAQRRGTSWLWALWVLTRHEFRGRYRGQALGVLWSVVYPLVMMGILTLIFSKVWPSGRKDYPVYVLIGLVVWQFVSSALNAATGSFIGHAEIIKRTVFPRQLLPLAVALSFGINFLIEAMVVLFLVPVFPGSFSFGPTLLLVPIILLSLILFLAGCALAMSVLNVIYRDVAYLVQTGLLILYWLTPVIYRLDGISEQSQMLLKCNPLTGILSALRGAIMDGTPPSLLMWASFVIPSLVTFGVGWLVFKHYERSVLDYV